MSDIFHNIKYIYFSKIFHTTEVHDDLLVMKVLELFDTIILDFMIDYI